MAIIELEICSKTPGSPSERSMGTILSRKNKARGRGGEINVSIVIPCFNRQSYIADAIESAQSQGPGVEVIVVDDGSTDGSAAIIASYPQVRSFRCRNSGPSAARNLGVQHSRGHFVRFLDSDDRLPADSTGILLDAAQSVNEHEICFGDTRLIDDLGASTSGPVYGYSNAPSGILSRAMVLARVMQSGLPLFPADILRSTGGFDERLRIGEDYELAVRIVAAGYRFSHVPRCVYEVREHQENRLSRGYGQAGFKALVQTFETSWQTLNHESQQLHQSERNAVGRIVWGLARGASRERLPTEAEHLFALAAKIAGSESFNAPFPLRFAYRIMAPYRAERMLEASKAIFRSVKAR